KFHPYYYFIIDRDHNNDEFVERCWTNFPDPKTNNLLVWRKREIENYFLDPAYLLLSAFCIVDEDLLKKKITKLCSERLFFDVANHVITTIQGELIKELPVPFTNPRDCLTAEAALNKLLDSLDFQTQSKKTSEKVSSSEIKRLFNERLEMLTGGKQSLEFGKGNWLEMISGKEILSQVINSNFFTLPKGITQNKKVDAIARDLICKPIDKQPTDFQELRQLILKRIGS
ncbi:MAG: hypothetical protein ACRC2T_11785, partial [Thermoguttaceae bacterium]